MATYKVLQDVEAEDKLVGPLTLRQFIYAGITVFFGYLSFFAFTKNVPFLLLFFVPPALFTAFLAIPWHGDQPTEVWAIAKLRFMLKPRKRIWDQAGAKELVTITVPKRIEKSFTDGLSQNEVHSRLRALADTIDSRGWVVKNTNVNMMNASQATFVVSDRLVDASSLPQDVSNVDIRASDDILDARANKVAQNFDSMIVNAAAAQRQHLIQQMQAPVSPVPQPSIPITPTPQPAQPQPQTQPQQTNNYWFLPPPAQPRGTNISAISPVVAPGVTPAYALPIVPQAAVPTADEEALVEKFKAENVSQAVAEGHLKHVMTPAEIKAAEEAAKAEVAAQEAETALREAEEAAREMQTKAQVTSTKQAAIMSLASNDDLDVATLARQAKKDVASDDGEVVVTLR
ncbi:PrgI family protein [Candidatus Saccharibacteria bacterium]|nr:PrgI family protein [Candidatus Saccharibacteria bacterium]